MYWLGFSATAVFAKLSVEPVNQSAEETCPSQQEVTGV